MANEVSDSHITPRGKHAARRFVAGLVLLLLGALGGWFARGSLQSLLNHVTTTALSPDDQLQAVLIERGIFIDRNFAVRLGPAGTEPSKLETIFRSPDEGRPIGSERFIWSKDGNYVLLVGRHFITEGQVRSRTGEDLYLLYHIPTKQIWCNARQAKTPRFGFSDLRAIELTQPVLPQERKNAPTPIAAQTEMRGP